MRSPASGLAARKPISSAFSDSDMPAAAASRWKVGVSATVWSVGSIYGIPVEHFKAWMGLAVCHAKGTSPAPPYRGIGLAPESRRDRQLMSAAPPTEDIQATAAWLRFLARDLQDNPDRSIAISEAEAMALEKLVQGVVVSDDEVLPDDVTF